MRQAWQLSNQGSLACDLCHVPLSLHGMCGPGAVNNSDSTTCCAGPSLAGAGCTYILQSGDSLEAGILGGILQNRGITAERLQELNPGLGDLTQLPPGGKVVLCAEGWGSDLLDEGANNAAEIIGRGGLHKGAAGALSVPALPPWQTTHADVAHPAFAETWSPRFPPAFDLMSQLKDTSTRAVGGQCSCGEHIVGWTWTDAGYPLHVDGEITDPWPIDNLNALCSDNQWLEVRTSSNQSLLTG